MDELDYLQLSIFVKPLPFGSFSDMEHCEVSLPYTAGPNDVCEHCGQWELLSG